MAIRGCSFGHSTNALLQWFAAELVNLVGAFD